MEAIRYFADLDVATEYVAKLRWPDGPVCPKCGVLDEKHYYIKSRRVEGPRLQETVFRQGRNYL
jgi:hypothetical protein